MPGINPFQGPIDYSADVKSPFEEALRGFQMGAVGAESRAKAQGLQQDMERNKALGVVMQNLVGKIRNGTAVGADFHEASLLAPPDKAETILKAWDSTSKEQQQGTLAFTSQVMSALDSSTPRIGIDMLNQRAAGERNSGNEENAKAYETYAKLAELDPANVAAQIGGLISPLPGGKDVIDAWVNSRQERRAEELHPAQVASGEAGATKAKYEANNTPKRLDLENRYKGAEIRNLDSQIGERAGRLGLDRDKLQSETESKLYELNQKTNPALNLEGDAKKIINDSTVASVAADQSSNSMLNLAVQLEKSNAGYGALGSAAEWLKKTTGNQDVVTQMRQEYARIRSSQVSKMLPPGAASDKDIELAMAGFPPDTADAATLASFLRGMSKLNTYTAVTENAKAEWVNSVGHLGKPKTDINVDGVNVPAGSTFTDFARQYIDSKVSQRQTQQDQSQVQSRSYMRWAQPQGAQ